MWKIVIGKFLAASIIIVVTELCTYMYFAILCFFGKPHISNALVTQLGFLLLGMSYISLGILASSITENQIVAGILTTGLLILSWFLPQFNNAFTNVSLINMFAKFPRGEIDIADTITFISFIVMCLALTIIFMQRRKMVK